MAESVPHVKPRTRSRPAPSQHRRAAEFGQLGARAALSQRYLSRVAAAYPDAFPARPFDPAMFATIALSSTYCAPWLDEAGSRILNLASLWAFGLDWHVEQVGTAGVDDLVRRCLAVAEGTEADPGDGIAGVLAQLRTDLVRDSPAFDALNPLWTEALRQTLVAMRLEQCWTAGPAARPSVDTYMDNATSTGFTFVFVTLWVAGATSPTPSLGPELTAALTAAQRVLRLANEFGTYERDVRWGDLNVLMLGMSREQLTDEIDRSTRRCSALLARLPQPQWRTYLERQVGFAMGMYGVGDFWGER